MVLQKFPWTDVSRDGKSLHTAWDQITVFIGWDSAEVQARRFSRTSTCISQGAEEHGTSAQPGHSKEPRLARREPQSEVNGEEWVYSEAAGHAAELEPSHAKEKLTSMGLHARTCLTYSMEQGLLI